MSTHHNAMRGLVAALSGPRAAMFERLREADRAVTVAEVTELVGQHRNTVRGHLDALVTSGLVLAQPAPSDGNRGRPAMLYRVNPDALASVGDYADVAGLLAEQLSSQPGARAVAGQLGLAWAERVIDDVTAEDPMGMLVELGVEPDLQEDGRTVLLHGCPLAAIATDNVVACEMHSAMLRRVLTVRGTRVDAHQPNPENLPCRLVLNQAVEPLQG